MKAQILLRPSKATPALEAAFVSRAIRIELAAGIAAARIGSETSPLKPVSRPPTGSNRLTGAECREMWDACENHIERLQVLKVMQRQLGVQTVDRARVKGTIEWKLRIAKDQRASAIVGLEAGISPSRVRQLRMAYVAGDLR